MRLLDEAIAEHGSEHFDLDHDFYWKFSFPKEFDLTAIPDSPEEVGSLHADWEMTHWIPDEPSRVGAYALTEVAPLLDYVGNRLARRDRPDDTKADR